MKSAWEGAGGALVVGRFAPSPSGPLHFGSLVAALGSCLSARRQSGCWLLRIEDVDTPRAVAGAAEGILHTLERFGFEWDGPVVWQRTRTAAYREAFARLQAEGRVFGCACTRKEMADSALARDGTRRYPGTCRDGLPPGREARAWRLRVPPGRVTFEDGVQGEIEEDVGADVGDFVLLRAEKADATVAGSPYSEGIVLSSAGATPVNVPTVASTMSTAALTITGLTGGNKEYNGNTDATFTGTAAYSGLQNGEMFSVTGRPMATFASANVGMGITINVTGYTAPNSNYTLTQTILSANITQKPLTITGIMADNKVYDGDNTATLSGTAALVGVITADLANVTLGGTPVATFDDELVGMNKPVTFIGYSISGITIFGYEIYYCHRQ